MPQRTTSSKSLFRKFLVLTIAVFCFTAVHAQNSYALKSPSKEITLQFSLSALGSLQYSLQYKNKSIIRSSSLGLQLADGSLNNNLLITSVDSSLVNESWKPVWGEVMEIRNNYRQLVVHLKQQNPPARMMDLIFRVFNDGLGFRYYFPVQQNMKHFIVTSELSQFALTGNHKAFWIPGDYDSNEYPYTTSPLGDVDAQKVSDNNPEIAVRVVKDPSSVATPLMLKTADGLYVNIHEAALVNYPAMQLHVDKSNFMLTSNLVPDGVGNKAYLQTPFSTPWRTIIVSDKAADILPPSSS